MSIISRRYCFSLFFFCILSLHFNCASTKAVCVDSRGIERIRETIGELSAEQQLTEEEVQRLIELSREFEDATELEGTLLSRLKDLLKRIRERNQQENTGAK